MLKAPLGSRRAQLGRMASTDIGLNGEDLPAAVPL
jgi:hypothetical protein